MSGNHGLERRWVGCLGDDNSEDNERHSLLMPSGCSLERYKEETTRRYVKVRME